MVELYNIKVTYTQFRVLLFIVRHTFGYNKISDSMSYGFISKGLSISRPNVLRELVRLEEMKIISISKGRYSNRISFNCNSDEWDVPRYNDELSESDSDVRSEDNRVFSEESTVKSDSSVLSADNSPLSVESTPVLCGENKSVLCRENQKKTIKTNNKKTTKKKDSGKIRHRQNRFC